MAFYEYENEAGERITRQYSMKKKIPETVTVKKVKYKRVYSVPYGLVKKSLGSEIDKNTKRKEKEMPKKLRPEGSDQPPWWRPNKKKPDMSLAKLSESQKKDYIATGKK